MPDVNGFAPCPGPGWSLFVDQNPTYVIQGVFLKKSYTFLASVILNTSDWTSFTPIIGMVPIFGAPNPAERTCVRKCSHDMMTYVPMRPSGSGAAESPKSIDMPLNDSITTLFFRAFWTSCSPARVRPVGNTGRQYVI
ncbi:hypothetical protein MT325_m793L [Paramecium bursaria chlorella virus MT325]|uniref:Uncharacterized protein m793L n=1 Tax=Paramecium bursaria Chlorella virus MT325 TaxID=346932 RepID=A7IVH3_PBCVM|nr:hypothetical protein MT325_m793L [Paramecium bursaria chlorella virus MT325]